MSELGVGKRVYVGFTSLCDDRVSFARCSTGEITDGPYPPGWNVTLYGDLTIYPEVMWDVLVDHSDKEVAVAQSILFPIDDWGVTNSVEGEHATVL